MKKELKMKEMEKNKKIDRRSTRTRQPAIAPMATERLQKWYICLEFKTRSPHKLWKPN